MNNQVHRALFRKEGEGKERERKKITTIYFNGLEKYNLYSLYGLEKLNLHSLNVLEKQNLYSLHSLGK